jgi:hypothetical protein
VRNNLKALFSYFTSDAANNAVKLNTARTIDGVSFDGSANIQRYAVCSTAAATVQKDVTITGFTAGTGAMFTVKFTVTNTAASPTISVNGATAKPVYYRGAAVGASVLAANSVFTFVDNGTQYDLIGINADNNTTYTAMTQTEGETGTATTARSITAAVLKAVAQFWAKDVAVNKTSVTTTETSSADTDTQVQSAKAAYAEKGGTLSTLTTTAKTLVPAINELVTSVGNRAPINATLTDAAAATALPGTTATAITSILQTIRNNLKQLFSYFTSGAANAAVKLNTARTIAVSGKATGTATSFDGTANISIPITALSQTASDYPTLNQNTTGNAATATALQTARTIDGVSFNGTANITPMANAYFSTSISLAAANWTGSAAPYTYTVTNSSLKATGDYTVCPQSSITVEQLNAAAAAMIVGGTQSAGSLTLIAKGVKPTVAIPVIISGRVP